MRDGICIEMIEKFEIRGRRVCCDIHTNHVNALCGQNVELLNVKLVLNRITTGL
jgi:hypothetical protein